MKRADAIEKLREYADAIRALGGTSLYLFGSTARGEAGPGSDLDVFIDYDPQGPFNAFDLVAAKQLLEAGLGIDVDLTTRGGLHPLISRQIQATAIRIF